MKTRQIVNHRILFVLALGLATSLTLAEQSKAALVINVGDSTASAGERGSFDITLENTDTQSAFDIAAFSIDISMATDSKILFNKVANAPDFIFEDVFDHFTVSTPSFPTDPPSPTLTVVGGSLSAASVSLAAGGTVGLIRVSYEVAANASGGVFDIQVHVGPGQTELSDSSGPLEFTVNPGSITVLGDAQVIPEPSSIIALATAAALLPIPSLVRRTRRKAG